MITEEHLELLRGNCNGTDEELQEAFEEAMNAGYADNDGWSNNPSALIAFIDGYLIGKS